MDIIIDKEHDGATVKRILVSDLGLSHASISRLKRLDGGITLNGERVTVRAAVKEGDLLSLAVEDRAEDVNADVLPMEGELDVLYEDGDCIAVNKPSGIATHPSREHPADTLANIFAYRAKLCGEPFVFRPVNRLDRETSGIVLCAKNKRAAAVLGGEMVKGNIKKKYYALLCGDLAADSGEISGYVVRAGESIILRRMADAGRDSEYSLTRWRKIASDGAYTLVEAEPVTGRTHQLRVHFSHAGHPIAGDGLYGNGDDPCGRLALHAHELTFGGRTVTAPLPEDLAYIKNMIDPVKGKTDE